jgi:hypothetical protein
MLASLTDWLNWLTLQALPVQSLTPRYFSFSLPLAPFLFLFFPSVLLIHYCCVVLLLQVQSLTPRAWGGTCGVGVSLKMCGEDVAIDGLLQGGAAQVCASVEQV